MAISNDFYINDKKCTEFANKALDWFIRSWKLKGEDKEIALLYKKKYERISMEHLEKAKEALNGQNS